MGNHFQRGVVLFDMERYREAIYAFTSELQDDPQCAEAYAMRAACWLNLGRLRYAKREIKDALALDPSLAYSHYIVSYIRSNQGRSQAAEAAIREALRTAPNAAYFCRLAEIMFDRHRHDDCLAALDDALALEPTHASSLLLRAKTFAALGRIDAASDCLRTVLSDDPENPSAHHALGTITLQSGNSVEARGFLREARRLSPITHNDRNALAAAYGRLLWPIRVFDRFLFRYEWWTPTKRWLLLAASSTLLILVAFVFQDQPYITIPLFVVAANLLLPPLTIDSLAAPLGKVVFRRDLDVRWYRLLPQPIWVGGAISFHAIVSFFAAIVATSPAFAMLFLLFVTNFELILVFIRHGGFLASAVIGFLALNGVFMPATLGVSFLLFEPPSPIAAAVAWAISLAFSYILTVHWR
jgi:Flp pilus assembly protein TadD